MTWREVPLGSVCTIFDGPHATPEKTGEGPVFLGISNLNKGRIDLGEVEHLSEEDFVRWTRRVTPCSNDVVFSYETRLGEAAIIPQGLRCCLGRRMGLLRPDLTKVAPRFMLYAYLGPDFQGVIRERTIYGSTVERILLEEMGKFPVRLAPLPEQRAIAHILGTLDDKIELNRRLNQALEATGRAIFTSWFVDYEGQTDLVGSELGPMPRSWRVASIGDMADNIRDGVDPGTVDAKTPYVGLEHVPQRTGWLEAWGRASEVESGKTRFRKGDVLFGKLRPYFHKVVLAAIDGVCSTDILVIRPRSEAWTGFAYGHLFSAAMVAHATALSDGTKMPRTSWENLCRLPIPIPPIERARAFQELSRPLMARVAANALESRTLATTRDALLPKLLTGELRVRDAERATEDAP